MVTERSMRILHVMASRANGGAETYSADMMESLHAAGVEQVAVIPRASIHHDRLAAAGVRLAADVLDARLGLLRRRKLAALIEAFRPDLVHCWMRRAASLVPKLDVPVIGWFGGYYEPANFPRCSHFVGVTPAIVEHMVARGVPKARAHYVPTFPTIESAAPVERADLATPADATVLLTLSRLHEKKGLDVLLQALAELPACLAWIAGDGPLEADLKALAARLGVADRVALPGLAQRPRRAAEGRRHLRAALALGALRHGHAGGLGRGNAAGGGGEPGPVGPDRGRRQRSAGAGRRCAGARGGDPAAAWPSRGSEPT